MSSPADALQYQVSTLHDLIAGVQADQWDDPTPCATWTVRDLANHLVGGGAMFAASFRGETVEMGDGATPDLLGDDPTAAWDQVTADFAAAVSTPGAMDREVVLPFASLPAPVALDIATFDLLVHAWDLARATGQSFDPPADLVAHAQPVARPVVDGLRDGNTFKDATATPEAARDIDALAAYTGRIV
jgi:uncharacterized protein (TIGR03086 family)